MNHRYADCQNADPDDLGDCACMGTRTDLIREIQGLEAQLTRRSEKLRAARADVIRLTQQRDRYAAVVDAADEMARGLEHTYLVRGRSGGKTLLAQTWDDYMTARAALAALEGTREENESDQVTHLRAALERIASATGWHECDEDENCFDIARAALGATE